MNLNLKVVHVFIYRFFIGLSLPLGEDISKVTVHERIQHLYPEILSNWFQLNVK
jgi:hypothetical protein